MILYRDQFDLDDCFNCLLAHSVFHGGDPAIAANWQLPPEFFEKYWFLTIDYDLRRTTNRWRRLQGLNELDFKQQQKQQEQELKRAEVDQRQPILEHPQSLNWSEISSLLGIDFWKIAQQNSANMSSITDGPSYASSLSSDCSFNSTASPALSAASPATMVEDDPASSFEPVRLTDGYNLSYPKPQPPPKRSSHHKPRRHHPYYNESTDQNKSSTPSDAIDPWDTVITEPNKKYGTCILNEAIKKYWLIYL